MKHNKALSAWVSAVAEHTKASKVYWCDGTESEFDALTTQMVADGSLIRLNPETHPNCFLHRSDPDDVARVEHLTYVCTAKEDDAGPNNHWMAPADARARMDALFAGCMQGRTLYVIPYVMGPPDATYAQVGVEITDSPYVVINMHLMARVGAPALTRLGDRSDFVRGLHSTGELDPERRFIMHFPESGEIMSYGSGYGGNALLGKKCHALRLASHRARAEGWLAEHMLILGIQAPNEETRYVAAAFPSACGKTNMAMLVPPAEYAGYKMWTVGDDIAWLFRGPQGEVRAINPEAGFFGVAPGTGPTTNPVCLNTLGRNTIYTNVGLTPDGQPWWEGIGTEAPAGTVDWQGRPWSPGDAPAAHPNARFTVSKNQCPTHSDAADDPAGVPISAIIFGGRRATLAPLVYEARDWAHGVFTGATMASETTAAAVGQTGRVRRDPMAMQPFCGYNFADYWRHWLEFGTAAEGARSGDAGAESDRNSGPESAARSGQYSGPHSGPSLPHIFHVNWFRRGAEGGFIWPGFGQNLRVLEWILKRCAGQGDAVETPLGYLPAADAINLDGLDLDADAMDALLTVDGAAWNQELDEIEAEFAKYGNRIPSALTETLADARRRFAGSKAA